MILCFRNCFIFIAFLRFTLGDPIISSKLLASQSSLLSLLYLCVYRLLQFLPIVLVGVLIMQDYRSNTI
ncbi:hypothetical protein EUGRSUZ_H01849 [Eucalyptus grandis]|uniref:Uncharacterized protein n=2 Tax=Eucalyptus grandis TaxID=71139 RepID=A0ACC3JQ35_EUCGR|nr:hypothetical protein EUGRSUZ_H01849 [Eucalyptus grandis]